MICDPVETHQHGSASAKNVDSRLHVFALLKLVARQASYDEQI